MALSDEEKILLSLYNKQEITLVELAKEILKQSPLTDIQIKCKWIGKKTKVGNLQEFMDGVRWAEERHGIK